MSPKLFTILMAKLEEVSKKGQEKKNGVCKRNDLRSKWNKRNNERDLKGKNENWTTKIENDIEKIRIFTYRNKEVESVFDTWRRMWLQSNKSRTLKLSNEENKVGTILKEMYDRNRITWIKYKLTNHVTRYEVSNVL